MAVTIGTEPALIFRDKYDPAVVRVEWFDEDGGCEVSTFSRPRALERALAFGRGLYSEPYIAKELKAEYGFAYAPFLVDTAPSAGRNFRSGQRRRADLG